MKRLFAIRYGRCCSLVHSPNRGIYIFFLERCRTVYNKFRYTPTKIKRKFIAVKFAHLCVSRDATINCLLFCDRCFPSQINSDSRIRTLFRASSNESNFLLIQSLRPQISYCSLQHGTDGLATIRPLRQEGRSTTANCSFKLKRRGYCAFERNHAVGLHVRISRANKSKHSRKGHLYTYSYRASSRIPQYRSKINTRGARTNTRAKMMTASSSRSLPI